MVTPPALFSLAIDVNSYSSWHRHLRVTEPVYDDAQVG